MNWLVRTKWDPQRLVCMKDWCVAQWGSPGDFDAETGEWSSIVLDHGVYWQFASQENLVAFKLTWSLD